MFNGRDLPAEFIDATSGKRLSALHPPETGDTVIIPGMFSGDGRRFVAMRQSKRDERGLQSELGLAVWDVKTGKRVAQRPPAKEGEYVLAVSPDGKAAAVRTMGAGSRVSIWEPDTGRTRWRRRLLSNQPFVTFTRDSSRVVVQEIDPPAPPGTLMFPIMPGPHPLLVLDGATGKELIKANGPVLGDQPGLLIDEMWHTVPSTRALSPDGRTVAISGFDGTIYLWELATDKERCRIAHPGPVHELAFSPDGRTLAAASLAGPVILYDLSGGRHKPKPAGQR
jgi:WD40 repeat protein